jgi:FkbM family methyltransferase
MTFLQKLWNTSPRNVLAAVRRRLSGNTAKPVAETGWVRVRNGPLAGHELWLAPAREPSWRDMAEGTFDAFMFEPLAEIDLRGTTLWDIGAHFGYHTLSFAALAGEQGHVLSFEPNPTNQSRLKQNLARNPDLARRIEVQSVAVSDKDGDVTFVYSEDVESGLSSNSHVADATPPQAAEAYAQFKRGTVPAVTIDSFFFNRKEHAPAVIKIDVEGAEALVLEGGQRFFASHKPIILMEVHHITAMLEVQASLMRNGYQLAIIGEKHSSPSRCFIIARPGLLT